jgi:predicted nucleic acid-binding protein
MAQPRLRVALDTNVLIAGIIWPRWPHEVLRAALARHFDLVLPEQVVEEARRHLSDQQQAALDYLLAESPADLVPMPSPEAVAEAPDLVRHEPDIPIALAVLAARVDLFVTSDRDFTDPGAVAERFSREVKVMLPAVFLRDVLGWSSEALEAIRTRSWDDLR